MTRSITLFYSEDEVAIAIAIRFDEHTPTDPRFTDPRFTYYVAELDREEDAYKLYLDKATRDKAPQLHGALMDRDQAIGELWAHIRDYEIP